MKVCNYLEFENFLKTSGIETAVRNQRKALKRVGVDTTDNPRDDFDVLHTNTIGPGSIYYIKKSNLNGKKIVIHAHTTSEDFKGSFRLSNKLSRPLKKYLEYFYKQGDILLCPTEYTKNRLKEYGLNREPVVVSNGVDTKRFKSKENLRRDFRNTFDLKNDVVFAVGSVFERKGVSTFIEVAKEFPDNRFIWFGPIYDNLQQKKTKKAIKESPENVFFTGKIDNVLHAYSAGDIFFFPSNNENQGIAVLEAASCGKPIVIKDIPGFDYLTHNEDCLKGRNLSEFKDHLESLMDNKDKRKTLAKKARKTAQEHSLERVGKKLKKIYSEFP